MKAFESSASKYQYLKAGTDTLESNSCILRFSRRAPSGRRALSCVSRASSVAALCLLNVVSTFHLHNDAEMWRQYCSKISLKCTSRSFACASCLSNSISTAHFFAWSLNLERPSQTGLTAERGKFGEDLHSGIRWRTLSVRAQYCPSSTLPTPLMGPSPRYQIPRLPLCLSHGRVFLAFPPRPVASTNQITNITLKSDPSQLTRYAQGSTLRGFEQRSLA